MRLTRKIDLQQRNLAKEHLAYLSLNLLIQEMNGLLLIDILFRIKRLCGRFITVAIRWRIIIKGKKKNTPSKKK